MSYEPVLTARIGKIDPASLTDYEAHGGFQALIRAVELGPGRVVALMEEATLLGRGGAAFPAGIKWRAVHQAEGPKFVVANADESEPGTFKDRVLMEGDPYALIEAVILAGFATAADKGFIYVRGEYARAYQRLRHAIARCYEAGYLGRDILGSGFEFHIELRRGAGAYICGEETALFESIEGKRGYPRLKPPFPTQAGLFGRPTLINNVETLINALHIVLRGPAWFNSIGPAHSPGPKLYPLSGRVQRPGLVEAPMGITLRELIEEHGGGVSGSGEFRVALVGGAAGAFLGPDHLNTPLDFRSLASIGAALGSGAVIVFDTSVDMKPILQRIADFFAHESCGKCYPCQLGTMRQRDIIARMVAGQGRPGDLQLLRDIGQTMRDTSICGLGQTASNAILSAFELKLT